MSRRLGPPSVVPGIHKLSQAITAQGYCRLHGCLPSNLLNVYVSASVPKRLIRRAQGWPGGMKIASASLALVPRIQSLLKNELGTAGSKKHRVPLPQLRSLFPGTGLGPFPLGGFVFLERTASSPLRWTAHAVGGDQLQLAARLHVLNDATDLRKNWLRSERWFGTPVNFGIPATVTGFRLVGNGDPLAAADTLLEAIGSGDA